MSVGTRLVVWRHGRTDFNLTRRFQGQLDTPLDETGRAQARSVAPALARLRPDAIVSSDLRRAADTAAALAERTGRPVRSDVRLRERAYGEWQGLTFAEVRQRWPETAARWRAGDPIRECGIEGVDELAKRVTASLRDAAEAAPGGVVVVVTHGGAARHGIASLLGWPETVARTLGALGNCRWSELWLDPARGWQLRAHNVGPDAEPDPAR